MPPNRKRKNNSEEADVIIEHTPDRSNKISRRDAASAPAASSSPVIPISKITEEVFVPAVSGTIIEVTSLSDSTGGVAVILTDGSGANIRALMFDVKTDVRDKLVVGASISLTRPLSIVRDRTRKGLHPLGLAIMTSGKTDIKIVNDTETVKDRFPELCTVPDLHTKGIGATVSVLGIVRGTRTSAKGTFFDLFGALAAPPVNNGDGLLLIDFLTSPYHNLSLKTGDGSRVVAMANVARVFGERAASECHDNIETLRTEVDGKEIVSVSTSENAGDGDGKDQNGPAIMAVSELKVKVNEIKEKKDQRFRAILHGVHLLPATDIEQWFYQGCTAHGAKTCRVCPGADMVPHLKVGVSIDGVHATAFRDAATAIVDTSAVDLSKAVANKDYTAMAKAHSNVSSRNYDVTLNVVTRTYNNKTSISAVIETCCPSEKD